MIKATRILTMIFIMSLFLLPTAACGASKNQSGSEIRGNLTVSGAFALYPMMTRWAEEFQKVYPNVQFDISAGGAGKGMADALSGAVDIGMVSRDITPEEETKGAFWVAVVKDAVFPMVNIDNPVLKDLLALGITQEKLINIYITGEITTWGQIIGQPGITDEIHVYTRSDAAGAPEVWAKFLGNKKQEDLLGVGVFGDPGLLEAVIKDPLGLGFNNLGYAFDNTSGKPVAGAVLLPIDENENGRADPEEVLETKTEAVEMVAQGKYPSPPARPLNLVTKEKPSGLVLTFLNWILNDGQKFVDEAGYVQLTEEQISSGLQKLK